MGDDRHREAYAAQDGLPDPERPILEPRRSRKEDRPLSAEEARRRQAIGRYEWVTSAVGLLDVVGPPGSRGEEDGEGFRAVALCRDQQAADVLLGVIKVLDARTPDHLPSLPEDFRS